MSWGGGGGRGLQGTAKSHNCILNVPRMQEIDSHNLKFLYSRGGGGGMGGDVVLQSAV